MSKQKQELTEDVSKKEEKPIALVSTPKKYLNTRSGRGFSLKEIKAASIPLDDAQRMLISIDPRRRSLHDENVQVLSTLYRQITATRSEAAIKLDKSTKEALKELKQLKNIKSSEAKLLIESGIKSVSTLVEEDPISLADDTKINAEKIERWIAQAKTLMQKKGVTEAIEELCQIKGMNKSYAKKLVNFGILSTEDLSKENAEILAKDIKISDKIISVWIEDAMRLTGKPIPKKKPIKQPKEEPEIAAAVAIPKVEKPKEAPSKKPKEVKKEALSLKDIDGLGKGDIKELNKLGINTLEGLAKEDPNEIASITGINEATIQNWINKAKIILGIPVEPAIPSTKEPVIEPTGAPDPLTEFLKLPGVGKKTAEKLVEVGFKTINELLECDPKQVSKQSKISEKSLKRLIEIAKEQLQ